MLNNKELNERFDWFAVKRAIKRVFPAICYICPLFNIIIGGGTWCLPLIFGLDLVINSLIFSNGKFFCEGAVVDIFRVTLFCLSLAIFLGGVWSFIPWLVYIMFALQGGAFYLFQKKYKKISIRDLICITATTALSVSLSVIQGINCDGEIQRLFAVGVFLSLLTYFLLLKAAKKEVVFELRKYFNTGKDVMDEY